MSVYIGSARINEYGRANGGRPGDQNSGKEVSIQEWYQHDLGWKVFRCKDRKKALMIADDMEKACKNNNIGYCQDHRDDLYLAVREKDFDCSRVTKPTEVDCSKLVQICCKYAGIPAGNFTTSTAEDILMKTGMFKMYTSDKYCKSSSYLHRGDILCTKKKGHIVVVLTDGPKAVFDDEVLDYGKSKYYPKYTGNSVSIVTGLEVVGEKDTSRKHRAKIAEANGIKNYNYTSAQNLAMLKLLKEGKLVRA